MNQEIVSAQVRDFIRSHIHSVAQLEILLLLQSNPAQAWTAADIAREFRIEPAGAARELAHLAAAGLVQAAPAGTTPQAARFTYAPKTPALHAAVVGLAQAYLVRRVTVIEIIFASPPPSTENLRAFSDAFLFRKEPPR